MCREESGPALRPPLAACSGIPEFTRKYKMGLLQSLLQQTHFLITAKRR